MYSKRQETKWEKDVARLAQIFDPRSLMNRRERNLVIAEGNVFGIPYTGARTSYPRVKSGPTRESAAIKSMNVKKMKQMRKQDTINPTIANDPNDPLRRIIERERTQGKRTVEQIKAEDYNNLMKYLNKLNPEKFPLPKKIYPGIKPENFPSSRRPRPEFNPWRRPEPYPRRPSPRGGPLPTYPRRPSPRGGPLPAEYPWRPGPGGGPLPASPFYKPEAILFGKSMSKRAIPTQRTDNTRNKYGI